MLREVGDASGLNACTRRLQGVVRRNVAVRVGRGQGVSIGKVEGWRISGRRLGRR